MEAPLAQPAARGLAVAVERHWSYVKSRCTIKLSTTEDTEVTEEKPVWLTMSL